MAPWSKLLAYFIWWILLAKSSRSYSFNLCMIVVNFSMDKIPHSTMVLSLRSPVSTRILGLGLCKDCFSFRSSYCFKLNEFSQSLQRPARASCIFCFIWSSSVRFAFRFLDKSSSRAEGSLWICFPARF